MVELSPQILASEEEAISIDMHSMHSLPVMLGLDHQ